MRRAESGCPPSIFVVALLHHVPDGRRQFVEVLGAADLEDGFLEEVAHGVIETCLVAGSAEKLVLPQALDFVAVVLGDDRPRLAVGIQQRASAYAREGVLVVRVLLCKGHEGVELCAVLFKIEVDSHCLFLL